MRTRQVVEWGAKGVAAASLVYGGYSGYQAVDSGLEARAISLEAVEASQAAQEQVDNGAHYGAIVSASEASVNFSRSSEEWDKSVEHLVNTVGAALVFVAALGTNAVATGLVTPSDFRRRS